jgi:hypothetical protein
VVKVREVCETTNMNFDISGGDGKVNETGSGS